MYEEGSLLIMRKKHKLNKKISRTEKCREKDREKKAL